MKKTIALLTSLLLTIILLAQAPQSINYQGVARDNTGSILVTQPIGLRISIRQTTPTGTVVYQETHSDTTNQFGLFNIAIGGGTVVSGTFSAIDWGSDSHFVEVEMDETGGTNYQAMGTSQLLSVPYALYAETTGLWQENNDTIYYNNGRVGIGTTSPFYQLHIKDTNALSSTYLIIDSEPNMNSGIQLVDNPFGNRWVLEMSSGPFDNDFSIHNYDGTWSDRIFRIESGAPGGTFLIDSSGNVGIGTNAPGSNKLKIKKDLGSNDPVASQHIMQFEIQKTTDDKALAIGILDNGKGFIQAKEVNIGYQDLLLNPMGGNVAIGTYVVGTGIILMSPNLTCYKITVDNAGNLITTSIACP